MYTPTNLPPNHGKIECTKCKRFHLPKHFPERFVGDERVCILCIRQKRFAFHDALKHGVRHDPYAKQGAPQLARWSKHGSCAPPFKTGTPEYSRWYRDVKESFDQRTMREMTWPEYYAGAKYSASLKPPKKGGDEYVRLRFRGLFGGAHTKAYQAWYRATLRACHAAGGQDWPEFFTKAREVEMRKQGLLPSATITPLPTNQVSIPNISEVSTKPRTNVDDNPAPLVHEEESPFKFIEPLDLGHYEV